MNARRLAAARERLMGLAAIGFIAVIYIKSRWLEVGVLVLAICFIVAALGGYAIRWRQRDRSDPS
jgi:hypothetical protein